MGVYLENRLSEGIGNWRTVAAHIHTILRFSVHRISSHAVASEIRTSKPSSKGLRVDGIRGKYLVAFSSRTHFQIFFAMKIRFCFTSLNPNMKQGRTELNFLVCPC